MSEPGFTPGPWIVEKGGNDIHDSEGELLACAYAMDSDRLAEGGDDYATARRNAKLIAAAPDLYLCLERLLREAMSRPDFIDPETETFCRDALAKARGKA